MRGNEIRPVRLGEVLDGDYSIRILSMDGGGIYGYTTARMLRWLCEHDPHFLKPLTHDSWRPGAPWLFAGTSAGALNALVLASVRNPRRFVLEGGLEDLWHRRATFANQRDPIASALSWSGVTGWFGKRDFKDGLQRFFGERTLMSDLHHRVAISAFAWRSPAGGAWHPKVYVNFPRDESDRDVPVWKVAYAAAAPAGLRAIVGGVGDGGVSAPDPTIAAIVEVIKKLGRDVSEDRNRPTDPLELEGIFSTAGFFGWIAEALAADDKKVKDVFEILKKLRILSVGVGAKFTDYALSDFDFGPLLFNMLPTNLARGNVYPPYWQIGIDAPTEVSQKAAQVLIGESYHRLDPDLMGPPDLPPTLVATILSRFPAWQDYFLRRQRLLLESRHEAKKALRAARRYLRHHWADE